MHSYSTKPPFNCIWQFAPPQHISGPASPKILFTVFGILVSFNLCASSYINTSVSVHRRDRCTCTTINQIPNKSQTLSDIDFLTTAICFTYHCTTKVQFFLRTLLLCSVVRPCHLSLSRSPFARVCLSIDVTGALALPFPSSPPFFLPVLFLLVLACLSIDVTGALVLLLYSFSQRL